MAGTAAAAGPGQGRPPAEDMAPPIPRFTSDNIILLAQNPSSTLPTSFTSSTLRPLLLSPSPDFLFALLSLLSRSHPFPRLSAPLVLSFIRLHRNHDLSRHFHLLIPLISELDSSDLPSTLDALSSHISDIVNADEAQAFDVLPHLLNLPAADSKTVDAFLEKLLSLKWSKALLVKIVSLLCECPSISSARVSEFFQKIFGCMKILDIQDIPSMVYQLLLLASKRTNSVNRKEVISGMFKFFEEPMKGSASVVRQVEGTVLMHLNFVVKQDPSLGQEFVAIVQSDAGVLNHFFIVILLSAARIRRFNESSIGALRSIVVGSQQDCRAARGGKWLPSTTKEMCMETAKRVEKAITRAIDESKCGREHLVPSTLQFGFILLESVDGKFCEEVGSFDGLMGIEDLAIHILTTVFEAYELARNEVVEQCKFRILSLKHQQSSPVIRLLGHLVQNHPYAMLEYVARLKELLDYFTFMYDKTAIFVVRAILPLIKFSHDLQDYIILVVRKAMFRHEDNVRTAAASVIVDLIIEEHITRRNGLNTLQESSSQASSSQQVGLLSRKVVCLFQDLSRLLRRCLTQQVAVKEILYSGFTKLVTVEPSIAGPVFDFLWPHFLQFYSQDGEYPIRIDACYRQENGKASLLEPLDNLISCVSWVLLLQQHGGSNHASENSLPCFGFSLSLDEPSRISSIQLFSNALSKIRKTLSKWIFEVALKRDEDPGSRSFQGEKFCIRGCLLLGILEVFINMAATDLTKATQIGEAVLEKELMWLVDSYDFVEKETGLNKQVSSSKRGSSKTSIQYNFNKSDRELKLFLARGSFLSTTNICKLLVLAANSYHANQESSQSRSQSSLCKTMDQCFKLIMFALKICLRHLKSISCLRESSDDPFKVLIYGDCKQLSIPILRIVWLLKSGSKVESDTKKKEAKGKRNLETKGDQLLLALLCLNELFSINPSEDHISELIEELVTTSAPGFEPGTVNAAEEISHEQAVMMDGLNIRRFKAYLDERIKPLYSELVSRNLFKEAEVVSKLFLIIWRVMPFEQKNHYAVWIMNVWKNKNIVNAYTAGSVVALVLHIMPATNDLIVAQEIAAELLQVMGSEEKDPMEISEKFPFVNHSTKNAVAVALIRMMETSLVDVDWSVLKLKAAYNISHEFVDSSGHQFSERLPSLMLEDAIYLRSEELANLMSFFAKMNLKDSQAEQFLKLTAKFYKLLARMAKLQIAPKGFKQLLPGQKFQKLAKVTCGKLTSPLYSLMSLVQQNQQESAWNRGTINKIKREKRCIPDLIFQIEDYERYLIQLSKLTKVNLLRHAKRSTARDFKILELEKATREEEAEHEPCQVAAYSNSSEDESEGSEGVIVSKKAASLESLGEEGAIQDVDPDKDEEVLTRRKRAKMCKVVHESEDGE